MLLSKFSQLAVMACFIGVLVGCGGSKGSVLGLGGTGGSGGGGATQATPGNSATILATTFNVNVNTGKVSVVTPPGSLTAQSKDSKLMFTGNSIGFTSTVLQNDPLETGVRTLQVTLTNNTDFNIGGVYGLRVIFGPFANTTSILSQEANTNVSTYAGSSKGFGDGSVSAAKMSYPSGVAVGPDGSVYVADYGNNRIRKINGGYESTLVGSGTAGEVDGKGLLAELNGPYGIALNPVDGSLIVADAGGNKVRRITTAGIVTTVAGTGASGSANGAGNSATFSSLRGVAVDHSGNIYVSESGSNWIRKITLVGSPTSSANYTVALYAGSTTSGNVNGLGSAARFYEPLGLTTDSSENVYVADEGNNEIRMIDPSQNVTTIAGTGTQSDLDGYGNGATFDHPVGVAYLNGAILVSETTGDLVREVFPVPGASNTPAGWIVETLAGQTGVVGSANGVGSSSTFSGPTFLAVTSASSIYLADTGNNLVRRVNPSSGTFPIGVPSGATSAVENVALTNPTGFVDGSDFGSAPYLSGGALPAGASEQSQWNLTIPSGVTSFQFQVVVEASTDVLVPLQAAVNAGSPLVDVRTYAGTAGEGGQVDSGAPSARFGVGCYVAADRYGDLYVADKGNDAIRLIAPNGTVSTIAGLNSVGVGYTDGAGTVAQFSNPLGIAVAPSGTTLYVADYSNNAIRKLTTYYPGDPNPSDWTVSTVAGGSGVGYADGVGTSATLYGPAGVAVDPNGLIFFSEYAGNRVRRLDPNTLLVTTIAGDNTTIEGATGFVNGTGPQTVRFYAPYQIACDLDGHIYVADYGNNVIRVLDADGKTSTYAGGGSGHDGPAASASFRQPLGVCTDSAGSVYVAEAGNDDVRRISNSGYVETVAGTGGYGNVMGSGATAEIPGPLSLAVTSTGEMYVGTGDNVIELIQSVISQSSTDQPAATRVRK